MSKPPIAPAHTVDIRMEGAQDDLRFWITNLQQIAAVMRVSAIKDASGGWFYVTATISRRTPVNGGESL